MKAITLWQPWASLIAIGVKPYETRDWAPPRSLIGKRVAIHAARRPIEAALRDEEEMCRALEPVFGAAWYRELPLGAVVCTADLDAAFKLGPAASDTAFPAAQVVERMTSRPMPSSFTVRYDAFGNYHRGRWAWLMSNVEMLDPPIPAKGAQGWWDWDHTLAEG